MRMIGKPEWFTYRAMGWGMDVRTWQSWVYVAVWVALFAALGALPLPERLKIILMGTLVGVFTLDCLVIMTQLGKVHDERERLHQLIIERNCSFAAVIALVGVMGYQTYQNLQMSGPGLPFDPLLLAVLGVMVLTKLGSTLYLRWKR